MKLGVLICAVALSSPLLAAARPGADTTRLERGLQLLKMQEHEAAKAELEMALNEGPYSYDEVIALYRGLGIVRAFASDIDGARRAFGQMLSVDPTLILSYTLSPKATFVFERVRNEVGSLKGIEIEIDAEPVVPLDRDIPVMIRTKADPYRHVKRLELLYRIRGDEEYNRMPITFPPVGSQVDLKLPEITSKRAHEKRDGKEGAYLEMALVGYDDKDWEIYRGPTPAQPQELAVGFDARGPWYTQWWAYGLAASSLAAVAASVFVYAAVKPPQDPAPTSFEVR